MVDRLGGLIGRFRGRQPDQTVPSGVLELTSDGRNTLAILGAHRGSMQADLLGNSVDELVAKGLATMVPATAVISSHGRDLLTGKIPNNRILYSAQPQGSALEAGVVGERALSVKESQLARNRRIGRRISAEVLGALGDEVRIIDAFPQPAPLTGHRYLQDPVGDPRWSDFWSKTEKIDRGIISRAVNPLVNAVIGQSPRPGIGFAALSIRGRRIELQTLGDLRLLTELQLSRVDGLGPNIAAVIHPAVQRTTSAAAE